MGAARLSVHELERRVLIFVLLLAAMGTAAVLSLGPRASAASDTASATAPGVAGATMGAGGETWFANLSSSAQASWISTMVSDGIRWLRIDTPGNLGGWYNTEIKDAEAAGIDVDAVIQTWGMSSVSASTMGPMCTGQVNQLEPLGVQTYEVINEPNAEGGPNEMAPATYEPLLAACYSAIKAADPGATVLMGSLAESSGSNAAATYLAAVYAANGGTSKGLFDAVGMHPSTWSTGLSASDQQYPTSPADCPTNAWNPWEDCPAGEAGQPSEISAVRSVMDGNGDSSKAIWMTEFGCPTGTDGGYSAVCSDSTLAQMITDAYQQVQANPGDEYGLLGPLWVYDFVDTNCSNDVTGYEDDSGDPAADCTNSYGLFDDFGLYSDTGTAKTGVVSAFSAGAALAGSDSSNTTADPTTTTAPPSTTTTTAPPSTTTTTAPRSTTTTTTDPPSNGPAESSSSGAASAVGSTASTIASYASSATLSVDPQASGDAFVLAVSSGTAVSSVSGGGATWSPMAVDHDTSAGWYYELWLGKITQPGGSTITVTLSAQASDVELGAQEFASPYGASTSWTVDKTAALHNFSSRTITYPSLSPSAGTELYFGLANVVGGGSSPGAGTSAGFTYTDLSAATIDQVVYNAAVTGSVQPTASVSSRRSSATVAALLEAT